jgi:NhaA family Na+:H+ antiporter
LLAITIIAIFYTDSLDLVLLVAALAPLGLFGLLVGRGFHRWWVLFPLAALTWGLVHASGVHATVAGVLLAFTVPVRSQRGAERGLAEQFEHRLRPWSAGFAVPVFAFFAAGVSIAGAGGLAAAAEDPVMVGVMLGLIAGKVIGVLTATWLVHTYTRASLDPDISWWDVLGVAALAGIGFTVSLLIGELAFGPGSPRDDHARLGILAGSLVSAVLASTLLRARNRHYRQVALAEQRDADRDGIPDVYQRDRVRRHRTPS